MVEYLAQVSEKTGFALWRPVSGGPTPALHCLIGLFIAKPVRLSIQILEENSAKQHLSITSELVFSSCFTLSVSGNVHTFFGLGNYKPNGTQNNSPRCHEHSYPRKGMRTG